MKNIIVITDSAKIADVEFKSLRQKLMDKELLVKSDAMHWMLYTQQLIILFCLPIIWKYAALVANLST